MRTHLCGDIGEDAIGKRAAVCGWAHSRRDHGGVIFIDVRDHSGILQIVADPAAAQSIFNTAEQVRGEFVLRAEGIVRIRPEGTENPKLPSGKVELAADTLQILNAATPAPFSPGEDAPSEEVKLRHRIIDLRGAPMQTNLRLRHKAAAAARRYLEDNHFVEIETPMLTRATPEGARDFLSPSRLRRGAFYALPQSPQLFKQMLMAGGRYYQFARCFCAPRRRCILRCYARFFIARAFGCCFRGFYFHKMVIFQWRKRKFVCIGAPRKSIMRWRSLTSSDGASSPGENGAGVAAFNICNVSAANAFHFAARQFGVFCPFGADAHNTFGTQNKLAAHLFRSIKNTLRRRRVGNDLQNAAVVAHINKDYAAMVTARMRPAANRRPLADGILADIAAKMGSHNANYIPAVSISSASAPTSPSLPAILS